MSAPDPAIEVARRALAALDLTSLGEDDTPAQVEALCAAAAGPGGLPASVCVYPEHIATARAALAAARAQAVKVATVVNFPDGGDDPDRVSRETRRAVAAGADEVDMVLPWRALAAGRARVAEQVVRACREASAGRVLKVILESGSLAEPALIRSASDLALDCGADFVKTSTGKVPVGATAAAAGVMLESIRDHGGRAGLKVAGGVRTLADAAAYLQLADTTMGRGWASPAHFRIGASGLLAEIRAALGGGRSAATGPGY